MSTISVLTTDRAEFIFAPKAWPFAEQCRAEIDAHFAARREQNPGLWNGRVLLAHEASVQQDNLRFSFLETDFASFLAWWDWDFPDHTVFNCFAMGAIRSADGAFLLGQMGPHTAKPGRIYFPAGSPEPGDITNGEVDLVGNMFRELEEETGLPRTLFVAEPVWTAVLDGQIAALIRVLNTEEKAAELRGRIRAHLKSQERPELADVRIVRSRSDLNPMMPEFVHAFFNYRLDRVHRPE